MKKIIKHIETLFEGLNKWQVTLTDRKEDL